MAHTDFLFQSWDPKLLKRPAKQINTALQITEAILFGYKDCHLRPISY